MITRTRMLALGSLGFAGAVALAGCSADSTPPPDAGAEAETITLGYLPSWTDSLSNSFLLKDQLEKLGYTVELQTLSEAGPLYTALAEGDIDIYPSAWIDVAQKGYWEKYEEDLEDLGTYYSDGTGLLAVPTYMEDVNTIADLKGKADLFDGKIYGIEPGSGSALITEEVLMPAYGLDEEYELVTSSTPAMLAALGDAIDRKEPIVVTLWRPYWANAAYDIKELEDTIDAYGEAEGLHYIASRGFSEKFPDAAELIGQIKIDDTQYAALEDAVVNEFGEGAEAAAIDAWLAEYGDQFNWVVTD